MNGNNNTMTNKTFFVCVINGYDYINIVKYKLIFIIFEIFV